MSLLQSFLDEIIKHVRGKNGAGIVDLIHLNLQALPPQRQQVYGQLNQELNAQFPRGNDVLLLDRCKAILPQDEFGSFSNHFAECLARYFRYVRDFNRTEILRQALDIRGLTSQCVIALGDAKYGIIMIPIVLTFSRTLATVASQVDRNPKLLRQSSELVSATPKSDHPGKISFVEDAANVLRDAFIKCLSSSPGTPRTTRPGPADKRYGIYLTANSTLRLLFQCLKHRNAQQLFTSIDAQSPPLSFYPAAQRVTYLYYLGRYHFANNHFLRASLALQSAFDQCHARATSQRRLILTYLVGSHIIVGKHPATELLSHPSFSTLQPFFSLLRMIRSGDIGAFTSYLSLPTDPTVAKWPAHTRFFLRHRILLQLRNRCEVLVWRALIRRVFILAGYQGEDTTKKVPFVRLSAVRHAALFSLQRAGVTYHGIPPTYLDQDFIDIESAAQNEGYNLETGEYDDTLIGQDPGPNPFDAMDGETSPTIAEIESVFLSLIQQGLLRGFLVHGQGNPRFAIPGSMGKGGPVVWGFPDIYPVIAARGQGEEVPGWVKEEDLVRGGLRAGGFGVGIDGGGGARVVNLKRARPVSALS